MIRRLRIKFVCTVMAIVMLMLGIILGVVIHFTAESMQLQSINMMRTIAGERRHSQRPDRFTGDVRLPFFVVQIGRNGELISSTGGYYDLSDEASVLEIANIALDSESETGELPEFGLRYLKNKNPAGYTIVFSDTATETATLHNMFYCSLGIFLIALALFLGIAIVLSQWAIKPVETAWLQQQQFVADASHELKTPLSVIMANAELLQNDDTNDAERRHFSKNILSMTYQMRTLVENMLEMARVDNGAAKMHPVRVDFSQLVKDAVLSFQLLYGEKGMGLQCTVAENIFLLGSEQHLYQVLDVLLDNALKYSLPRSTVCVRLEHSGRNCVLSVCGSGDAIPEEEQKLIFKRFYRADKARAMDGSYGLGLSIAEAVVEAHKGKIWVRSAQGHNTFYVQLPTVSSHSI